jgi:malyl-CoA/(S)-citramalyl-CoA lyase
VSFTVVEPCTPRLHRSELAVPGSSPQFFEKAARSAADVVFLDLEDAVAPDQKVQARKNITRALHEVDWGDKTLAVRINGLDTPYMYRDVIDVIEQGSQRLDMIMIPKVGTAADVYALDMLVTQCEQAMGWEKRLGFSLIIETALGMANVDAVAAASRRNEALHFGVADYAASTRARTTNIGGPSGYRAAAERAAALGCEGKWAIHPSQIALANEVMSPPEAEVTKARRILAAMAQARAEGKGAASLDGRLIDIASIRQAEALVAKADQIAARRG